MKATSSQQYRQIRGVKRQAADAACDNCGHTWWSVNPAIRAQARRLDVSRKKAKQRA